MDGLLADLPKARLNMRRCLDHHFQIIILYVYQKPQLAWDFTQAREKDEGRKITKDDFIRGLIDSRLVAQSLKDEFDFQVRLHILEQDYQNKVQEVWQNVQKIELHVETLPSNEDLVNMIE